MDPIRLAEQGEFPSSSSFRGARHRFSSTSISDTPTTSERPITGSTACGSGCQQPDSEGPPSQPTNSNAGFKNRTPGWASIAAKVAYGYNTTMYPKLEDSRARTILYKAAKIRAMGQLLQEHDEAYSVGGDNKKRRAPLFDCERLLGGHPSPGTQDKYDANTFMTGGRVCTCSLARDHQNISGSLPVQDCKARILEALSWEVKVYMDMVVATSNMAALPTVSQICYGNLLSWINDDLPMEADARALFSDDNSDFVSTDLGLVNQPFESIIYTTILLVQRIMIRFSDWRDNSGTRSDENSPVYVNSRYLVFIIRALLGMCCMILLLTPVAILLLGHLSRIGILGVAVGFSAIFVVVLSILEVKMNGMLLALCAYVAVLTASFSFVNIN